MEVIERNPVPIYEVVCFECKSKIRYKACEISLCHITCPVCGVLLWANMHSVDVESEEEE